MTAESITKSTDGLRCMTPEEFFKYLGSVEGEFAITAQFVYEENNNDRK